VLLKYVSLCYIQNLFLITDILLKTYLFVKIVLRTLDVRYDTYLYLLT